MKIMGGRQGLAKWSGLVLAVGFLAVGTAASQSETGDKDVPAGDRWPGSSASVEKRASADSQEHFSKRLLKDFLQDQKTIWSSPSRIRKSDLKWLVPVAVGTAVAISQDRHMADDLDDVLGRNLSRNISNIGGPTNFVTATALFGLGHLRDDERMSETGLLALRAVGSSWATVQALKQATNRERPAMDDGHGKFWGGGSSFPSGHSASTWALATVVAERYPEKTWLKIGIYSMAGVVSATRLTGHKHFVSDVLVGGVIGHLIGRYVVRRKR